MQRAIKTSGFATETARSATETEEKVDDTALYSTSGKRTSSYSRRGKGGGGNYSKRGRYQGRGNGYDRKRGPSMRRFKGKYYLHDWKKHPNGPTEWERNITCAWCDKLGHAIRTCIEKKRNTKPKKAQQKNKNKNKNKKDGADSEEKADLAEEYEQHTQEWHEENDDYSDDDQYDYCDSVILPSSNSLIQSDSRYLCKPEWQAPLGYLLYFFVSFFYTIGEKIFLIAHQSYQKYHCRDTIITEIAYMTEESDEKERPTLSMQILQRIQPI
jgi:hypothetical protein